MEIARGENQTKIRTTAPQLKKSNWETYMTTLPTHYFEKREITNAQIRNYEAFSKTILARMFSIAEGNGMKWSKDIEKKGVKFYRNLANGSRSNISEVLCTCKFSGSLEEISRTYMTGNSEIYKRVMKKLNPKMIDAVVLHSIVESSPENPTRYIAIKWFSVQSSTPMVADRDFCCIECLDMMTDSNGNRVLIRVMQSIELDECPSLEKSHGLIRAKIRAGYLYREDPNDPTVIHAQHIARLDPCGFFPRQWAYKAAKAEVFSSIVQIRKLLERQRINIYSFISKSSWVPNNYRDNCHVCAKVFGTFLRPRHHCRACGDLVCGKCSVFREVDLPSLKTQLRVCVICSMGLRRGNGDDISETASQCSRYSFLSTGSSCCNFPTYDGTPLIMLDNIYGYPHPSSPSARSTQSVRSTADTRRRNRGFISVRCSIVERDAQKNSAPLPIDLTYLQDQVKNHSSRTLSSYGNDLITPTSQTSSNSDRNDLKTQFSILGKRLECKPKTPTGVSLASEGQPENEVGASKPPVVGRELDQHPPKWKKSTRNVLYQNRNSKSFNPNSLTIPSHPNDPNLRKVIK